MPGVSPEQVAQWQALIEQDPAVRQAAQQVAAFHQQHGVYSARNESVGPQPQWRAAVEAAMAKYGIPDDYEISYEGGRPTVQPRSWMDKHGKALSNTIIGTGAALTGLGAAGVFGGGAGAGSGAGGGMAAQNVAPFSGLPGAISETALGPVAATPYAGLPGGIPADAGGVFPPTAATNAVPSPSRNGGPPPVENVPSWLQTILKVAPVGAGLVNKFANKGFGGEGGPAGQMSDELSELLKLSMQRMRDQEPLFQSVTKQALAGLPTYAQGK